MSSGARPESVFPQKLTLPVSAVTAPVIEKSSVDLPAPLGPDDADEFALVHRDRDTPQRRNGAVANR